MPVPLAPGEVASWARQGRPDLVGVAPAEWIAEGRPDEHVLAAARHTAAALAG